MCGRVHHHSQVVTSRPFLDSLVLNQASVLAFNIVVDLSVNLMLIIEDTIQ